MSIPVEASPDAEAVRRRAAHEIYGRLALLSAVIWTLGTFVLFISLAAGHARPIPQAMIAMTLPLLPAGLLWLLYRPLTARLTARRLESAARPVERGTLPHATNARGGDHENGAADRR